MSVPSLPRQKPPSFRLQMGEKLIMVLLLLVIFLAAEGYWAKHRVVDSVSSLRLKANNETIGYDENKDSNNNIGLVSYCVGDNFAKLQEIVGYNHRAYAGRFQNVYVFQGNETVVLMQAFVEPRAWLKVFYLHELLTGRGTAAVGQQFDNTANMEWFLWIDCDALIARFDVSIESLLEEQLNVQPQHHMVVAPDKPKDSPFNTGVMFVRNCQWSLEYFQRALRKASNDEIRYHKWWEQKAFHDLYLKNLHKEQDHILIAPNGRAHFNGFAGMNNFHPEYVENETFVWHRVHCNTRDNPDCCLSVSMSFFCSKTPQGSYPQHYCDGIRPWSPPSKNHHC